MAETDDTLRWLLAQLPADELHERHAAIEEEIKALIRTRNVLQMAIEARNLAAKIGSDGPAAVPAGGYRPGSTEAVRQVLADAPYRTLTVQELMRALEERDWLPVAQDPRKAVGATLSRMVHRTKELEPMGRARYRLREAAYPLGNGSRETVSNRLFTGSADGEAESDDV
jgi:hypothetical protein